MRHRGHPALLACVVMSISAVLAAAPPPLVNYEGVLRDGSDQPLDGAFDMTFRFHASDTDAQEILVDQHIAMASGPIIVRNGLFNVQLGSGTISDGSGPGIYTSLVDVFRDFGTVWLSIQIGAETLSPRIRIVSAAYALNAASLNGQPGGNYLDTSSTAQAKTGTLSLGQFRYQHPPVGAQYGISTSSFREYPSSDCRSFLAPFVGAHFEAEGDLEGRTVVDIAGWEGKPVVCGEGWGEGHFPIGLRASMGWDTVALLENSWQGRIGVHATTHDLAPAILGDSSATGVEGIGSIAGGHFALSSNEGSTQAFLGYLAYGKEYGVWAAGSEMGGSFTDTDGAGRAFLGVGPYGISAYGGDKHMTSAGTFSNPYGGQADLAYSEQVMTSADAFTSYGIMASGNVGGSFSGSSASAKVGYSGYGVYASGTTAGSYFNDSNGTGSAYIGYASSGIDARGSARGGYFMDTDSSGYSYLGYGDNGILARGYGGGGDLRDTDNNVYAYVGYSTYKIYGNGGVSFVQNHPVDRDKVIVYTAPEGDEVAVYTRGTARLIDGEARVRLGATFQWVTNPDVGLTVHLTPVGEWSDLFVASKGTDEIVVKSGGGAPDAVFDYIVYGLRIGFEETSVVQEKTVESLIPSMRDHREQYARRPELRTFNALSRFTAMGKEAGLPAPDFSSANALRAAIHEYEPATDPASCTMLGWGPCPETAGTPPLVAGAVDAAPVVPRSLAPSPATNAAASRSASSGTSLAAAHVRDEDAAAQHAPVGQLFPVSEPVEAGDLLALDPLHPGTLMKVAVAGESAVVGVALGDAVADDDGQLQAMVSGAGFATVRADAQYAVIQAGDLLVASATPGHAMRAPEGLVPGTVIGKALEPLRAGTGSIKVLLMAR